MPIFSLGTYFKNYLIININDVALLDICIWLKIILYSRAWFGILCLQEAKPYPCIHKEIHTPLLVFIERYTYPYLNFRFINNPVSARGHSLPSISRG